MIKMGAFVNSSGNKKIDSATGKLITVEGGEGTGKSTFCQRLATKLEKQFGVVVETTREPGGTAISEKIRDLFVNPPKGAELSLRCEFLLVSAARAQHCDQRITKALAEGRWVVCDRFFDSSRVYQGLVGGLDLEALKAIDDFATGGRHPHATFLLDVPVDVAMQRLQARKEESSRFDVKGMAFHQRIRDGFLQLAKTENRFHVMDACQSPEVIVDDAMDYLKGLWKGSSC